VVDAGIVGREGVEVIGDRDLVTELRWLRAGQPVVEQLTLELSRAPNRAISSSSSTPAVIGQSR
jgi:hypothetical protein